MYKEVSIMIAGGLLLHDHDSYQINSLAGRYIVTGTFESILYFSSIKAVSKRMLVCCNTRVYDYHIFFVLLELKFADW